MGEYKVITAPNVRLLVKELNARNINKDDIVPPILREDDILILMYYDKGRIQ